MAELSSTLREVILPILNTIILIGIFFYQRNRNKLLSERIFEQNTLLKETSDILSKQSVAITSHGTIVESAMKYSQTFDIKKVEEIVRREVLLEKEEEIRKIKNEYAEQKSKMDIKGNDKPDTILDMLTTSAINVTIDMFKDVIEQYVFLLVTLPEKERQESVASISNDNTRSLITSLLERIFAKLGAAQLEITNRKQHSSGA